MADKYFNWKNVDLPTMYAMGYNKDQWHKNAGNKEAQDYYHQENMKLKERYGIGEEDDISLGQLKTYIAAAEKQQGRDAQKQGLITNLSKTEYSPRVQKIASEVENFKYDPTKDEAYQSYVDMYGRQGQSAAKQSLSQINSMNMGRGSSYSGAVAAQVQQAYTQKATEMIPTLAEQAYNKLLQKYSIAKDMEDTQRNRDLQLYETLRADEKSDLENLYLEGEINAQGYDNAIKDAYGDRQAAAATITAEAEANAAGDYWAVTIDNMRKQGNLTDAQVAQIEANIPLIKAQVDQIVLQNEGLGYENVLKQLTSQWATDNGMTPEIAGMIYQGLVNQYYGPQAEASIANMAANTAKIITETTGLNIDNNYKDKYWQQTLDKGAADIAKVWADVDYTKVLTDKEKVELQYLAPMLAEQLKGLQLGNDSQSIRNTIDSITAKVAQDNGMSPEAAGMLNTMVNTALTQKEVNWYDITAQSAIDLQKSQIGVNDANAGAKTTETKYLYGGVTPSGNPPNGNNTSGGNQEQTLKDYGFVSDNGVKVWAPNQFGVMTYSYVSVEDAVAGINNGTYKPDANAKALFKGAK